MSRLKNKRIELRVTAAQKDEIETAAAIEGRTLTDFSTDALTARAREVIQRDRQLRLDAERFDEFQAIMERPARTVAGLQNLFARRSVFADETDR